MTLNDWFPQTEAELPKLKRTNWPRAEERLRPILDAFQETVGFSPQGQLRQAWISGARDYVDNVGERPDLVRSVAEYMQEKGLIVKSPRSLIAIAMQRRDSEGQSKQDYFRQLAKKLAADEEDAEYED